MRVHCKVNPRGALVLGPIVEFLHREAHVVEGDVHLAGAHDRIDVGKHARHLVHVAQLPHGRPAFVSAPPGAAGSEPHRERLCEVFVGMLLRVPPLDVAHVVAAERHGPVLVAIRLLEGAENRAPVGARVQAVRVIEDVPRLVAHVAHDFAAVFEVVHRALQLAQVRIRQVERNPQDRLHVRAAPLVGEVAHGPELLQPPSLQLAVELPDVRLDGRSFQAKAQLADALAQHAAQLGIESLKGRHRSRL